MVWPAIIAGVASIAGGMLSNRSQRREAQRNRDFQERMSSTAHQREVVDLRAAGLNPILSGVGGAGAATSAGSMAAQADVITPAVSTAMEAMRNKEELQLIKTNEQKASVETKTSAQQGVLFSQQQDKELAATQQIIELTKKIKHETGTAASLERISQNEAAESDIKQKVIQTPGEQQRLWLERWLNTIGIGGSSAKQVKQLSR